MPGINPLKIIGELFSSVIKFLDMAYKEGYLVYLILIMIVLVIIVLFYNWDMRVESREVRKLNIN